MRICSAHESDTSAIAGDQMFDSIIVQFRTGRRNDAGTDANVTFQIGPWQFHCPDQPGNDNEKGAIYTASVERSMTMDQLRASDIYLFHDNTGKNPGWYVDEAVLELGIDGRPVIYKVWSDVGWLAADEGGCKVQLQRGVTPGGVKKCDHDVPVKGCKTCKERWYALEACFFE